MVGVAVVLGIFVIYILLTYNSIVKKSNKVKQAKSGIEVYLNQRFDLIPNLVECVKAYAKHEENTFQKIAELRQIYNQNKNLDDAEKLDIEMKNLILLAENNPELKASENFLNLQKSLEKIESQIQAARRIYNGEVNSYNDKIYTFPSNIIAKIFNFKDLKYFEAENQAKKNVNITVKDDTITVQKSTKK